MKVYRPGTTFAELDAKKKKAEKKSKPMTAAQKRRIDGFNKRIAAENRQRLNMTPPGAEIR